MPPVHPIDKPARSVQPFAIPKFSNMGPAKTTQPAAKELLAKSFAAKSEAAY